MKGGPAAFAAASAAFLNASHTDTTRFTHTPSVSDVAIGFKMKLEFRRWHESACCGLY